MRREEDFIPSPVATDVVIFTVIGNELNVLLVKRGKFAPLGWSLPGGFVGQREDLDESAVKTLREKTGVRNVYLEQLYTFGEPKRDPRGRVISIAYMALVDAQMVKLEKGKDTEGIKWLPVKKLPQLTFDHRQIIDYAKKRLIWKMEYTNVVFSLLPTYFSLTELQKVYEAILERDLDKRNFRRKFLSTGLIKETKKKSQGAHRPATLYNFAEKRLEYITNPFGQFLKK